PAVLEQVLQQVVFLRGKMNFRSPTRDRLLIRINFQLPSVNNLFKRGRLLRSLQKDFNFRTHFPEMKRLDEVIVSAYTERLHLGVDVAKRRNDKNRDLRIVEAKLTAKFQPVHPGQVDIQQHQIEILLMNELYSHMCVI